MTVQSEGFELAKLHLEQAQRVQVLDTLIEDVIVARDGDRVSFTIISVTQGEAFGHPLELIGLSNLSSVKRQAQSWLRLNPQPGDPTVRVDVIGIIMGGDRPKLDHLKEVF